LRCRKLSIIEGQMAGTPENLTGVGATNLSRARPRPKNNGPRNNGPKIVAKEIVTKE
jgi:hypothetical protein